MASIDQVSTAPGKALVLGLLAGNDRERHVFLGERAVHLERAHRLGAGVRGVLVGGVAFLPEELAGAEEHPRAHFPADHVGPLVEQQRQVAPRLDPAAHRVADDRLRGRADDQRLLELRIGIGDQAALAVGDQAVVGDHRHLLGEAFDVGRLADEVAERDEQREIGVFDPGGLDPRVEQALHALPDAVAPRFDHHAAADARFLGHVGGGDDLLVPGGEVVFALDGQGMADGGHGLPELDTERAP
jgi:hypothetical protein